MKHIILKFMICIGFIAMLASFPAYAVGLKENSIIDRDTITLGDIFYDLPRDDDRVLGSAPRPGQDMILNARTLLRIAMAMDLSWRPTSNADSVTLSRAATIIEYPQIQEALHTALYDEGVFGDFDIIIPNEYKRIILPSDAPAEMSIRRIELSASRKNFEAVIVAPSFDNPIQQIQVRGQIAPVVSVPVLYDNVSHGTLITKADIDYIQIREQDFTRDTIADADQLIGMTARRLIVAGRPIRSNELAAQQVIDRGSMVLLSLSNGMMNISTQARALENGAKGDVIRVTNVSSNKTIHALVTGENRVAIIKN